MHQYLRLRQASTLPTGVIHLLTRCPAVPAIEEKTKLYSGMVRLTRFHEDYKNPFWTEEENIEMVAIFPGDLG
jgi:hypothetical protein